MPNDMLELLLRDISVTEINAFAREIQTPADYELTRTVMPERTINSVKWETRGTRRRVAAASYRAWDAQTKVATREITQFATSGKLLPLGQKYIVGEFETILENVDRGMDSRDLVDAVYDDVAAHVLSIKKRLELAVADLLIDGKFSLVGENGLTLEADYSVPSANMPTAPVDWTDPTADILADEQRWIEVLRSSGAPAPARVLTSYKTAALMMGNNSYRAAYYGSVSPSATPTAVLAPNEVNVVRARYNLPPITTYDVKIELDTGSDVRALPENMFFLLPPNPQQWAETQYGLTADGLLLSQGGNPSIVREEAPGIVVTRGVQDDPPQVWTKGSAAALPVMYVPDIHIAATVW
ncbi:putative protoporphyrinogen oxidase (plasmid) [Streptomyces ambofaciens ATCC 23877]|uniref:Putative protoporphyrinogen oxidase n=1 Tax=Streptomyces ambofaciens (strain ATCC 23877 / 3486 / DSM 40053 / JCM 4204 / NBRC 12836 / NRRL B-2516) TaxID=278992 RepID=A0A0K2B6E1_STRA7|nr:major capsid protein [Streptomyces ambofaciens]AKZ60839.1 putative protoporphyrinogen oxidase [Streptomyces ambofaciens ATCC 23877]